MEAWYIDRISNQFQSHTMRKGVKLQRRRWGQVRPQSLSLFIFHKNKKSKETDPILSKKVSYSLYFTKAGLRLVKNKARKDLMMTSKHVWTHMCPHSNSLLKPVSSSKLVISEDESLVHTAVSFFSFHTNNSASHPVFLLRSSAESQKRVMNRDHRTAPGQMGQHAGCCPWTEPDFLE